MYKTNKKSLLKELLEDGDVRIRGSYLIIFYGEEKDGNGYYVGAEEDKNGTLLGSYRNVSEEDLEKRCMEMLDEYADQYENYF